jgi:two-component system chemotaxis response regulator CheY
MEALRLLAAEPVDLVLADLHMPEMDGVEMTRRILADRATQLIPVIIISAEPNARRLEQLKQEGVRGYLRKPFTPELVRNLINETLGVSNAAA